MLESLAGRAPSIKRRSLTPVPLGPKELPRNSSVELIRESNGAESKVHRAWFFATIVLFIALIVVALWAVYVDIDSAVTIGYFGDTIQLQQEQLEILSRLLPELHRGQSHADVLALLRELYPDAFIAEGDGFVAFNNIEFHFDEEQQLASVEIR